MRIAVTGTPGTGKTTVARILAERLKYPLLSANELLKPFTIGYDEQRKAMVVDVNKATLIKLPENCVIEGHLSHYFVVDLVVVLRCSPDELEKRLKAKKWPERKIRENLEAEAMGIISQEVEELGRDYLEIETSGKTPEEVVEKILEAIKTGKRPRGIDHSWWL